MLPRAGCGHGPQFSITRFMRSLIVAATVLAPFQFPTFAQTPAQETAPPAQSGEVFGEEVTLTAKTIVFVTGKATWDNAFPTLTGSFKSIFGFLGKQKLQAAGPAMTIYTAVNNTGFQFQAGIPITQAPANFSHGAFTLGQSPGGKALKFVHRGSYDSMDMLYETIIHYLDEKRIERQGPFVEEYLTDPVTTPEDQLVVNVFVLVK